MMPINSIVNN